MSGWVVFYAAVAACLVTAWLVVRRDRYAELTAAPEEFAGSEAERKTFADDREVRLAGVHEFAELADRDPSLRQDFVDHVVVQLGYGGHDVAAWQARLWPVLLARLRRGSWLFWPGMDLHVKPIVLHDVDLRGCELRDVTFRGVRFAGTARFGGAVFTRLVSFEGACFARHALFRGTAFEAGADFEKVTFTGTALLAGATAGEQVWFDHARFSAHTDFSECAFADVSFADVGFAGRTSFRDARFGDAFFGGARFSGHTDFTGTAAERLRFPRARARTDVYARRSWPPGWALGPPSPRKPGHWAEVVSVEQG
ncbi:Pentapeptide repeat-containing protein [Amycolatopsis pretoriensis]|uniref:Pentapeptide repeat-containing protein n=1 Tax=Amycolatopsis pretoriensis TaxID=218821 RepID=A0A1H5Q6S8_9PSEU|nr:pentapeptide repeat-containing protein [Amycolatopsis pretoriensis]SEF21108.1 Pentapeptide repeat-containing protein [Amycolatopsis pretoriensis]